jgi:hypothetical protein
MGIQTERPIRPTRFRKASLRRIESRRRRDYSRKFQIFEFKKSKVIDRPGLCDVQRHLSTKSVDQIDERSLAQPEFRHTFEWRFLRRIRQHDAERDVASASRSLFRIQFSNDFLSTDVSSSVAASSKSERSTETTAATRKRLCSGVRGKRQHVVVVSPTDRSSAGSYLTQRRRATPQPNDEQPSNTDFKWRRFKDGSVANVDRNVNNVGVDNNNTNAFCISSIVIHSNNNDYDVVVRRCVVDHSIQDRRPRPIHQPTWSVGAVIDVICSRDEEIYETSLHRFETSDHRTAGCQFGRCSATKNGCT